MYKNPLKIVTVLLTTLILLYSCTGTSDEPADSAVNESVSKDHSIVTEACKVKPSKEPQACTMQYDPVCGCDGKTYSNACVARAAGVTRTTAGTCEKAPVD